MIPETTVQKIKDAAWITDFTGPVKKAYGKGKVYCTCPACGYINEKKKQGLIINEVAGTAKCFKCDVYYSNPIDFIMKTEGFDYPDALRHIAKQYSIFIEDEVTTPPQKKSTGRITKKTVPGSTKKKNGTPVPKENKSGDETNTEKDELFNEASKFVIENQSASTSGIQRKFSIGYNRAGRIIDQLETAGIIGPFNGSKARKVLINQKSEDIPESTETKNDTVPDPENRNDESGSTSKKPGNRSKKTKLKKQEPGAKNQEAVTREEKPAADNKEKTGKDQKSPAHIKTFCDSQLEESGLTHDDIRVTTVEPDGTERGVSPIIHGTRDQYGKVVEHRGDDVLIKYFDLEGRPVMYKPEKSNVMQPLIRVRWQNPAAHPDRNGDPIKYQSPKGSGSHVYIPERLRLMYKHARKIKRLYIQEGEKKAEKSCKHGIMSAGIMGINNLGSKDNRLPDEIQYIIQRCEVEEVIFVLDADWRNLSENLKNGQAVDNRPRQFFAAVKSFKEYLRTLANLGHPVEIYFGYIQFNDAKEKGIDDLLTGSLAGKEDELKQDFEFAINEKSGKGKYIQVNKITMLPDSRIADFWLLNDAEKFAAWHKDRLKNLKEFKIKGFLWRFDEYGKLVMAQALMPEEEFWDEDEVPKRDGTFKKTLSFNYVNAMVFLQNRGFFRYQMRSGEKVLIRIENRVLNVIDHTVVKDFVKEFCREIKRKDVLNMLMKGGPQYLGPEKLTNLDLTYPTIERANADKQYLFFTDKIWEITADGIKEINYGQFPEFIWNEKIIHHKVKALPPLFKVSQLTDEVRSRLDKKTNEAVANVENGEFFINYSEDADKSHFLQFLINTSDFYWKRVKWAKNDDEATISIEESFITSRHLVNKFSMIGYLLHDYKDDNELKAAIAMDGKISEVGASNGRSGKSLVGKAIAQVIPQVIIDGKNKKLDDDNFRYHEVTEKTKNLFFDDVRANFDFESLFQVITGGVTVNQKSGLRFTLRQDETPKILITTNHAINGIGSSFQDRQAFMVFSDFYNDNHKPVNDFNLAFFSEWEGTDQWNLFYNLMAQCLVVYFKSKQNGWSGTKRLGIVPPPMEDVEKRKLRQTMGENFLTWADAFFDWDEKTKSGNLNQRHIRFDLFQNEFLRDNPQEKKYTLAHKFKEKTVAFCHYKGYDFNPTKTNDRGLDYHEFKRLNPELSFIGDVDKTGGKEYFTIANQDFNEAM